MATGVAAMMLLALMGSDASLSPAPHRAHMPHMRHVRGFALVPSAFARIHVVGFGLDCARLRSECAGRPCLMRLGTRGGEGRGEGFVHELCLRGPTSVIVTVRDRWGRQMRVSVVVARALDLCADRIRQQVHGLSPLRIAAPGSLATSRWRRRLPLLNPVIDVFSLEPPGACDLEARQLSATR